MNEIIDKMYSYFDLTDDWYAKGLLAQLETEINKTKEL